MKSDLIRAELTTLDLLVNNSDEFFEIISKKLVDKGFVKESFLEAIKAREAKFPTGLPIRPEAVAIPHTDAVHICKPFIAPIRLKQPIKWCEMAADDVQHNIRFIFILGIQQPGDHLDLLQILVENLQDQELMNQLISAQSEKEYMEVLCSMKGID